MNTKAIIKEIKGRVNSADPINLIDAYEDIHFLLKEVARLQQQEKARHNGLNKRPNRVKGKRK